MSGHFVIMGRFVTASFRRHPHLETRDVDAVVCLGQVDVESVVGPGAKLEVTALVIKREPGDVNLTRRLEYSYIVGIYDTIVQ